jgi:hypothetical protein
VLASWTIIDAVPPGTDDQFGRAGDELEVLLVSDGEVRSAHRAARRRHRDRSALRSKGNRGREPVGRRADHPG